MSQGKCCVCQRKREIFKSLTLTSAEKWFVEKATGKPSPDTSLYCKPCWAVVTNKIQGPQLMKGMMQLHLRNVGVSNGEAIASKVQDRMVKYSSARKPS